MPADPTPEINSEPPKGWTEPRKRRAKMFIVLFVAAAAATLWATWQPWYSFSTAGPVPCNTTAPVPQATLHAPWNSEPSTMIAASDCVTGKELATQASAPASPTERMLAANYQLQVSPLGALFGLPRSVALASIASALAALCLLLRNGWLGFGAFVGFYYAHGYFTTLTTFMTSGQAGALNDTQPALAVVGWSLLSSWALSVATAVFVIKHNREQRKYRREQALADGTEPPASPMDHMAAYLGRKFAHAMNGANQERELRATMQMH